MNTKYNFLRFQVLLLTVLALQACGAANAVKSAETVEQRAYAAYGEFVIVAEQAAKLVSSGRLDNRSVIAIGRAEGSAKEVADSLIELTVEFEVIRAEYLSGETGESRFIIAADNLNNWVERLLPLVANLQSAKEGVER